MMIRKYDSMIRKYDSRFLLRLFSHFSFTKNNRGWTLIEVGVVVIIVGILASLALPSFNKMQARNQLRGTMSEVQGAFQEAQRNAIKRGAACTVSVNTTIDDVSNNKNISSTTPGCVPNPVKILPNSGISFILPTSNTNIAFSYKGNPSTATDQTIVLTHEITSLEPRCLVIATGIGIMRSGYYQGSTCTPAP
jgi:prepilin-type N-terminal cleavage/methylation domain-containing protein